MSNVLELRNELLAVETEQKELENNWSLLRDETEIEEKAFFNVFFKASLIVGVIVSVVGVMNHIAEGFNPSHEFSIGEGIAANILMGGIAGAMFFFVALIGAGLTNYFFNLREYAPGIFDSLHIIADYCDKKTDLRHEIAHEVIDGDVLRMVREKSNEHTWCYLAAKNGVASEHYVSFDLDENDFTDGVRVVKIDAKNERTRITV